MPELGGGVPPEDLFGDDDLGTTLAAVDWRATPLGPVGTWPQGLRSMVRVMLSSRFSMWLAWGPELTFFCNDAYRRDTLGSKYPWALGRPASEVWAEIWADVAPRVDRVMRTRQATWDEALQLFLERDGYREETYHTFSYSPLSDDDGDVAGLLCVVSEDTERVVGAQRMAVVRDVGAAVTALRSEEEVLEVSAAELERAGRLLPFTLTYLLDEDSGTAVLGSVTGFRGPHEAAPPVIDLATGTTWPLAAVLSGRSEVVHGLRERFGDLPTGGWDDAPAQALLVPFRTQGEQRPVGFLVAGLNPYRVLDTDHRGFVELLAGQVAASLSSARAYTDERRRAERLVELDRAKTDFFTNVSHEFRTPLTLMLGPAEDALADPAEPLGPAQRERVEVVHRNGERLLKLVDTLLDFSRLESGTGQARFERVDLAEYTAELADTFRTAVERVGLDLQVRCEPTPGPVWVDRDMWAKIVLNLLSNALKFTFEGEISVRLRPDGGGVVLEVSDTGTGISPAEQERLFQRFARVAGARSRSFEGSGIGLALVSDLAALHGGSVDVRSGLGSGSTFSVHLPTGAAHLPAEQLLDAPEVAPGRDRSDRSARGYLAEASRWLVDDATPATGTRAGTVVGPATGSEDAEPGPPRILVVDDNSDMREYVARLLEPDHEVLLAADGRAGLALARDRAPDLVLSDVMMPGLDGVGLLRELRADPRTAHVPVVLVSARSGEDATVQGLEAGADDYLAKPFSSRELLARVRANLELERVRRTRRQLEHMQQLLDQAQRLARVGSWELDLATGAITASEEFVRQADITEEQLQEVGFEAAFAARLHPDDAERVTAALQEAVTDHAPVDYLVRLVDRHGEVRTYRTLGEVETDEHGVAVRMRGSNQDVTEQQRAEAARAEAAALAEAADREHRIADELQRWLLPAADVQAAELTVAASYSAGAEGTQVGGDWYDVIELGGGRTALVVGDVMGRGVRAAAVMGQLRSAVRAFARLDLPPSLVLEYLDGVVRDLGEDQIVTCLYAVYDPYDATLTVANAGHLPPLVRCPDGAVQRLGEAQGPPLGTAVAAVAEQVVQLEPGALLVAYTDGLVEDRERDIDDGIADLAGLVEALPEALDADTPRQVVRTLLPRGSADDIALLMAQVHDSATAPTLSLTVPDEAVAVPEARHRVATALAGWGVSEDVTDSLLLVLSELLTNALVHGRPPVGVRLRRGPSALALEVHDDAQTLPRRGDPDADDEHGRGLQLVSVIATRWGTRPTSVGKAVWCTVALG